MPIWTKSQTDWQMLFIMYSYCLLNLYRSSGGSPFMFLYWGHSVSFSLCQFTQASSTCQLYLTYERIDFLYGFTSVILALYNPSHGSLDVSFSAFLCLPETCFALRIDLIIAHKFWKCIASPWKEQYSTAAEILYCQVSSNWLFKSCFLHSFFLSLAEINRLFSNYNCGLVCFSLQFLMFLLYAFWSFVIKRILIESTLLLLRTTLTCLQYYFLS